MNNIADYFNGIATIVTGLVAWVIYKNQKRENKIQAAKVLIIEIRTAEERINQIREKITSGAIKDLPPVFPVNSWQNYSHLFVSDFDQDELKLITSFYDYGELIGEFAKRDNEYFWVTTEERAKLTVQKTAELSSLSIRSNDQLDINTELNRFNKLMDDYNMPYSPKKTIEGIRTLLNQLPNITTSSFGIKLKKIARLSAE